MSGPQFVEDQINRTVERTRNCASARAHVTTATKALSNRAHIQTTLTAQTHSVSSVREFTKKERHFHAIDTQRVIHNAFTVLLEAAASLHLFDGQVHVGERSFTMKIRERSSKQTHL